MSAVLLVTLVMGVLVDVAVPALFGKVHIVVAGLARLKVGDLVPAALCIPLDVRLFARMGALFGGDGGSFRSHGSVSFGME
jgi:flagellar motor switch protein FliM